MKRFFFNFQATRVVPSSLKHAIVDCWCRSCVRFWVSVRKLVRSPCQVRFLNIEISIFELSPRREAHFWTTILKNVTRGATVREVGRTCLQGLPPGLHFHFDRQKPWFGAHFFRSPIRFACQILEGRLYQNFDFLSSRPDEKLIFDLNVKTNRQSGRLAGGVWTGCLLDCSFISIVKNRGLDNILFMSRHLDESRVATRTSRIVIWSTRFVCQILEGRLNENFDF